MTPDAYHAMRIPGTDDARLYEWLRDRPNREAGTDAWLGWPGVSYLKVLHPAAQPGLDCTPERP